MGNATTFQPIHEPEEERLVLSPVILGGQAISSTYWSAVGRLGEKGLGVVASVILARMLTPEDFGLFGLASVITGFAAMFSNIGVGSALIHKQDHLKENASAAFFMNLLIVASLAVMMAALAPWAVGFYGEPTVQPLIYVLASAFFIKSCSLIHRAYLQKFVRFKRLAIIQVASAMGYLAIAALLASTGFGVWSIALSIFAGHAIASILTLRLSDMPLSLELNWERWGSLFQYGRYLLGGTVAWYLLLNGDRFLIGKYLGVTALGLYAFAYNYSKLIPETIGPVLYDVMFPTFSALQNDYPAIRILLLKTTGLLAAVSFATLGLLIVTADQFVIVIFGEKWSAAIIPFQILLFSALSRTVATTVSCFFPAIGRPDITFYLSVGTLLLFVFGVWQALAFGLLYLALVVTFVFGLYQLLMVCLCCRIVELPLRQFAKSVLPALTASLLAAGTVYLANSYWLESVSLPNWVILSTLYLGLYTFFVRVLFPMEWREFVGISREVLFRFAAR
ncbi:MAG: lipopolysaccharide biosynthesis protein [Candidatus Binatia bacterium]